MTPRVDVRQKRRDQIIRAAMRVFARQGLSAARMNDIAEEAGLSKGTLYWYFKSKDEIIFTILSAWFERDLDQIRREVAESNSAEENLLKVLQVITEDFQQVTDLLPISFEFYALAFRDEHVRRALNQFYKQYLDILMPIFQQGVESGEFYPIDISEAATAIGALIEGTILLSVIAPETVKLQHNLRRGATLFLEGIKQKAA